MITDQKTDYLNNKVKYCNSCMNTGIKEEYDNHQQILIEVPCHCGIKINRSLHLKLNNK